MYHGGALAQQISQSTRIVNVYNFKNAEYNKNLKGSKKLFSCKY